MTNTAVGARPGSATLVNVADVIDPAITVTGYTPSQGTCVLAAGTCDLGTIPAGGTVTIIVDAVVLRANLSQIIPAWQANDVASTTPAVEMFGVNQAQISSAHEADIDSTPGNGFSPAEDDDNPAWVELRAIDMEVVKSINTVDTGIDNNDAATRQIVQHEITTGTLPVAIGAEATWSIAVTNRGPSTGTGVTVLDALPAEFKYVSSSSANGSYDPTTNTWTVGALANGQTATLNIVAILVPAWAFDQAALPTRNVNVAQVATADQDDVDSTPGDSVVAADDIDDAFADSIVGSLGDVVWLDVNGDGLQSAGEPGLAGVPVTLTYTSSITDSAGTVVVPAGAVVTTTTDASGRYLFTNLYGGTYDVQVTVPAGMVVTGKDAGSDNAVDSDATPAGLISASLPAGGSDRTFDAGMYFPASISNFVWEDVNGNGIQDGGEPAMAGVTVALTGEGWVAGVNLTMVTDASGFYLFDGLRPGSYHVSVTSPAGFSPTVQNVGGDDTVDSDPNAAGVMASTDLISGENDPTWDAGLVAPASIGDFVWNDYNRNGQQDVGEPGVGAVTAHLTGTTGTGVAVSLTTTTAADGSYLFGNLLPGVYTVKFDLPATFKATGQDVGSDVSDSDADASGQTVAVTLASGEKNLTVDAGLVELVDLQVVKTGKITDKGSHRPAHDATVEWKMVVTNNGPAVVAAGATLTDTLPAGLTFDDMVVPAGWSCPTVPVVGAESGSIGCISTAAMVVGASVTFVVHEHVSVSFDDAWKAAEPGAKVADFKNGATVQVVLSQFDINEPNNVSDDLVELIKTPTPTGSEILPVLLVAGFAATAGFGLFFVGRRRRTV